MAKKDEVPSVILELEENLMRAYVYLLEELIPQKREDDWTDDQIRRLLTHYRGLEVEAIDLLIAGEMPGIDITGRLEAAVSRSGKKPTVA